MSGPDGIYRLTRRKGKSGTVTQVTSTSANARTGVRSDGEKSFKIRWMVKEPTAYSRAIAAEAVQQKVGETSFVMWSKDPRVKALLDAGGVDQEDYVTFAGKRYEVVSSTLEEAGYVVTAKENVR